MSNVINFSAREFRFDKTCKENTGTRAFITTALGNTEAYEIGDWGWKWTQIFCEKKLEKNTDYIFRFAMTGGHNDTDDECHWRKFTPLTAMMTLPLRGRTG